MNLLELLRPISQQSPCGPEEAEDFYDLANIAKRQYAALNVHAEGGKRADWSLTDKQLDAIARKQKHVKTALFIVECEAHRRGMEGLRDGLLLLLAWSATWWEELHPGSGHPEHHSERADIITTALSGASDDFVSYLSAIPTFKTVEYDGAGREHLRDGPFSEQDHRNAKSGLISSPDLAETIISTFNNWTPEAKEQTWNAAVGARDALSALASFYRTKGIPIQSGKLATFLNESIDSLRGGLPTGGIVSAGEPGEVSEATGEKGGVAGGGRLNSRSSAEAMLLRVSEFFQQTEPTSPVPYFLNRAIKCMGKDFMEVLTEITGAGMNVNDVTKVLGIPPIRS